MAQKITPEMTAAAYALAKSVYEKTKDKKSAIAELHNSYGMNETTAVIHITAFEKMMAGEPYNRTISAKAIEHYFESILSDYGTEKLRNALQAAQDHVDYLREKNGGTQKAIRKLIKDYQTILDRETYLSEEIADANRYHEGAKKQITVNAYERCSKARQACIDQHGLNCQVCGFNFEMAYGALGAEYIHVHHTKPLSETGEGYEVDPINELVPVCPNCHAMLHKKSPVLTIAELQKERARVAEKRGREQTP